MTLHEYLDLEQGSEAWHAQRRGIVTASVVGSLITPSTIKPAQNVETRALTALLASERITGWTETTYTSFDMERGSADEVYAIDHYTEHYSPVRTTGFMVRDDWGFKIGYSPDGLVGDVGCVEVKSRAPKKHLQTILTDRVPNENMAQCQTALLVTGRPWCDYVSWCGGMPMWVIRVHPVPEWQEAIVTASKHVENAIAGMTADYQIAVAGLPPTERHTEMEITF